MNSFKKRLIRKYDQENFDDELIIQALSKYEDEQKRKKKQQEDDEIQMVRALKRHEYLLQKRNKRLITKNYKRQNFRNNIKPMQHPHSRNDEEKLQHGSSLFNIERNQVVTGNSTKFKCNTYVYKVKYTSNIDKTFGELTSAFTNLFTELHSNMLDLVNGKDKIRVLINHSSFDTPISFPFLNKDDFLKINLQDSFFQVIQSYREIKISANDPLNIDICLARLPNGGRNKPSLHPNIESFRNSSFITKVSNNDKLCAIYSVIIAIAEHEMHHSNKEKHSLEQQKKYQKQINNQQQKSNNQLKIEANRFLQEFSLRADKKYGIEVFNLLQEFYKEEYQITVVSYLSI